MHHTDILSAAVPNDGMPDPVHRNRTRSMDEVRPNSGRSSDGFMSVSAKRAGGEPQSCQMYAPSIVSPDS